MPIIEAMKSLALALIIAAVPPAFTLEEGLASWYGGKFQGRVTSSGEVFDTNLLTAAHKTLPFGTVVKVTNLENGRSAVVKINDRGPFVEGRIIDLSRAAAEQIDMVGTGTARVSVEVLALPAGRYAIQVGAYVRERNAENVRRHLQEAGYLVSLERTAVGVTRVLVRGVLEKDLQATRAALAGLGYEGALTRPEQPEGAEREGR
jgi:peptidoglycan lytic transglycosylase